MTFFLAGLCFSINVVAGEQRGHEHRCLADRTCLWVDQRHGHPGVVHFHDFSAGVLEMRAGGLRPGPAPVIFAELGVLVMVVWMLVLVLIPQQFERYPSFLQFFLDGCKVWQGAFRLACIRFFREQLPVQFHFPHLGGQRPMQTGRVGPAQVLPNCAVGELTGPGNRPVLQTGFFFEPKDFTNFAQR